MPLKISTLPGPSSLRDQAYKVLKNAILSLELAPGSALIESEVAEHFGISKSPVRDALMDLEREGLVTRVQFKGTYVSEISVTDVREIFQLRAVLEGLAARLAAAALTQEEKQRVSALLDAQQQAVVLGNVALASQLGKQFHELIFQAADNRRLEAMIRNLDDHAQRFRSLSSQITGRLKKSVAEHRTILAALCDGDGDRAEQLVREHLHIVLAEITTEGFKGLITDNHNDQP
jgi:DNA-binding GntR family transcriptional regulator